MSVSEHARHVTCPTTSATLGQCALPSDLNSLRRQRGQYLKQEINDRLGGPAGASRGARISPTIALSKYPTSFARETSHSVCSNLNILLESKHIRHHGRQEIRAGPSKGRRYDSRSLLSHHTIGSCSVALRLHRHIPNQYWRAHAPRKASCSHMLTHSLAGLARTDNNMEFTMWPQVNMINQKNYYTCV